MLTDKALGSETRYFFFFFILFCSFLNFPTVNITFTLRKISVKINHTTRNKGSFIKAPRVWQVLSTWFTIKDNASTPPSQHYSAAVLCPVTFLLHPERLISLSPNVSFLHTYTNQVFHKTVKFSLILNNAFFKTYL